MALLHKLNGCFGAQDFLASAKLAVLAIESFVFSEPLSYFFNCSRVLPVIVFYCVYVSWLSFIDFNGQNFSSNKLIKVQLMVGVKHDAKYQIVANSKDWLVLSLAQVNKRQSKSFLIL